MPDQQSATGPWRYFGGLVQNAPRPQARTMLRDLFGRGSRDRSRPDTAAPKIPMRPYISPQATAAV